MYEELKKSLCACAKRAYAQGMFAGTSGNLSIFDREQGVMAITPSSLAYEDMQCSDIVIMDLCGNKLEGERRPSSEYPMHAAVYRGCSGVSAVVHTHSPYATALAASGRDLPPILIEMIPYFRGGIGCAPFELPGTPELGSAAVPYLLESNACLLANHGVLTVGDTLARACERAVYVEDAAKIYCISQQVGGAVTIEQKHVEEMKRIYG